MQFNGLFRTTALAALGLAMTAGAALAQNTLIVAAPQTPTGFDGDIAKVATRQMVVQTYDGLTTYKEVKGANGRITLDPSKVDGLLAESWKVSPDGKTYVFKLREGVKSPWGNELTAEDVAWSFKRAFDIKRTSAFLYGQLGVTGWKALSKYEVQVDLKAPSHIFLQMLTMYFPMIHDSKQVLKNATPDDPLGLKYIDQNLVGYGPYFLESIRPGEQVVLKANPNYFRGKPYYERVIYREVPSAANRLALLKTGQVQWVEELSLKQINDLKKDKNVKVESVNGTQPVTIRMNPAIKPFDDKRVREAFIYATDYAAMNNAVFEGQGAPVTSMTPPTAPDWIEARKQVRDLAKAKALLAEAGYPNGLEVPLTYAGTYWWMEPVAVQFKNQAAEAGIRVNLQRIPDPDFVRRGLVQARDMALFPAGDATFVLDPVFALWIFGQSEGTASRIKWSNAEFDRLIAASLNEPDAAKRTANVKQAQYIQAEDATWINLFYPGIHQAMNKCITGWVWHPDDWPRFYDLRCEK